ncbi:MAG: type II toxin-antitoxin system VapC family toxin [Synergistaceae bacterium]|jgi:predicted nucleic acid-binding protein|nr:type II toxin-antitoxin system VapC family toxin [Synergistaceae bacterium]
MIIVLDCSVAVEIVLNRERGRLFRSGLDMSEKVITSALYKAETANTVWKYCRAGYLEQKECGPLLRLAENLVDEYVDISENNIEAMNEAIRLGHSVYDMLYLTLARRMGATLLTLDKRLLALAEKEGIPTNIA